MTFDLDREVAAAKQRLHRSIGQRARYAHADIKKGFEELRARNHDLYGTQLLNMAARMGLRVDNFGYLC